MTYSFRNHRCMGIVTYNGLPGLPVPLQCLSAGWAFNSKPDWLHYCAGLNPQRKWEQRTDCVISRSQDYLLINMCVHALCLTAVGKWNQNRVGSVKSDHCSGLSEWSHKPGPELKINEQLQSSQTYHQSLKHSDNTSTLPIPVEKKGTRQKQCASKSQGVNHKV